VSGSAPLLGAIADDVTGAADLCSTLVREGMRTVLTIGVVRDLELPAVDALVVALKSRTAPVAEAVGDASEALAWLRDLGAKQFFFKYCSTFDSTPEGNIGPVGDALLEAVGADITVVCPAYPTNSRTVYQGHLFVGDRLLSESSMARHPLTPMTDPDIARFIGNQTSRSVGLVPYRIVRDGPEAIERRLEELRRAGISYAVTDALEDAHLRAIGAACANLVLVTGASGVALGLPENFRRRSLLPERANRVDLPPLEGPPVVVVGSCSAATQEQVRRMAAHYPAIKVNVLDVYRGQGDVESLAASAIAHLAEGPVLVYTTAPPDEVARRSGTRRRRPRELPDRVRAGRAYPASRGKRRPTTRFGGRRDVCGHREGTWDPHACRRERDCAWRSVDDVARRSAARRRAQVRELRRA